MTERIGSRRLAVLASILLATSIGVPSRAPAAQQQGPRPELVLQTGISEAQTRVVFARDGRLLASIGGLQSSIKIWETATGRLLRQIAAGDFDIATMFGVRPIALTPDGAAVVKVSG